MARAKKEEPKVEEKNEYEVFLDLHSEAMKNIPNRKSMAAETISKVATAYAIVDFINLKLETKNAE